MQFNPLVHAIICLFLSEQPYFILEHFSPVSARFLNRETIPILEVQTTSDRLRNTTLPQQPLLRFLIRIKAGNSWTLDVIV